MGFDMYIVNPPAEAAAKVEELHPLLYGPDGFYARLRQLDAEGRIAVDKEAWGYKGSVGADDEARKVLTEFEATEAAHDEAERSTYFRLNGWGMSRCAGFMGDRRMLHMATDVPDWPDPRAYGLEDYVDPDVDYTPDSPEARFLLDSEGVRSYTDDPLAGIAAHKFWTNDGWVVTPDECRAALAKLQEWADETGLDPNVIYTRDDTGAEVLVEWWPQWLDFLRLAIEHGGFRVW